MKLKATIRRLLKGYLKLCQQAGHCDCMVRTHFASDNRSACCQQREG